MRYRKPSRTKFSKSGSPRFDQIQEEDGLLSSDTSDCKPASCEVPVYRMRLAIRDSDIPPWIAASDKVEQIYDEEGMITVYSTRALKKILGLAYFTKLAQKTRKAEKMERRRKTRRK